MRFRIAKRDLEHALGVVSGSVASTSGDISSHFLFRRTGEDPQYGIEVLTYSGRLFSSCPVVGQVLDPDPSTDLEAFTVEAKRLKTWLPHVPDSVIEFTFTDREVQASCPKGSQSFQSLNPNDYPYWDSLLSSSKTTATLPATRLKDALSYSKLFVSDREANQPELCVSENKGGVLYSTDRRAITLIQVQGLADSTLRLHGKDISGVGSFLQTCGSDEVRIQEHDRAVVFVRPDGACFGETKFMGAFPTIRMTMVETDPHVLSFSREDYEQALGFLKAGASWEDTRIRFKPSAKSLSLTMPSATGKQTKLTIPCELESDAAAQQLPAEGFMLDHVALTKILSYWKEDHLRLGLTPNGRKGKARVAFSRNGDEYQTHLVWLT